MLNANTGQFEPFDASDFRVSIAVSQFNSDITGQLLDSALDALEQYSVPSSNIKVVEVSGSIELPVILQSLAQTKKYDCLIALGAVIRGETTHYDYVCKIVSEGILRVQLDHSIPIGFGILTCENEAQARARISSGSGAAEAALISARIRKTI